MTNARKGPRINLHIIAMRYDKVASEDRVLLNSQQHGIHNVGDSREIELIKNEITQRAVRNINHIYSPRIFTAVEERSGLTLFDGIAHDMHVMYEVGRQSFHANITFNDYSILPGAPAPLLQRLPGKTFWGAFSFGTSNQWKCSLGEVNAIPMKGQKSLVYVQTKNKGTLLMKKKDFHILYEPKAAEKPRRKIAVKKLLRKMPVQG